MKVAYELQSLVWKNTCRWEKWEKKFCKSYSGRIVFVFLYPIVSHPLQVVIKVCLNLNMMVR